jgi:hypothetical protein
MTDTVAAGKRPSRWRFGLWLALLLMGILIGFLLAPRCPVCAGAGTVAQVPRGAPGIGDAKGRSSNGPDSGSPSDDRGQGGSGDIDPHGKAVGRDVSGIDGPDPGQLKTGKFGDSADGSGGGPDHDEVPADKSAPGLTHGDGVDINETATARHRLRSADDFRYDKTGLPRYSRSVSKVGSTLIYDQSATTQYHTTCAIVTSDKFQDVVDWYKANLPQGWQAQTVGDLNALASQVSVANIMNTLTAAAQSNAPGVPATATARKDPPIAHPDTALSIAMFSPPPGTSGEPGIMIQQKAGQPVEITMSRISSDP